MTLSKENVRAAVNLSVHYAESPMKEGLLERLKRNIRRADSDGSYTSILVTLKDGAQFKVFRASVPSQSLAASGDRYLLKRMGHIPYDDDVLTTLGTQLIKEYRKTRAKK
jgi:hypothetical protein